MVSFKNKSYVLRAVCLMVLVLFWRYMEYFEGSRGVYKVLNVFLKY